MSPRPDPSLLQTFVTIVESGSFTAAARRIHRTQSAVSMQVRRLEESIGRPLFEKIGRSMRLTPEGEAFFDHARRILRLYDQALAGFSDTKSDGEITVGAPDDYATTYLPTILSRFMRAMPLVRLTVICEPSRRLAARVVEGSVDIALVTEGEGVGGGIVLTKEELVWVASAHHPVHDEDPVPVCVFHSGDVFRRYAIEQLEENGRRARIVATSLSFAGISAVVDAGIAVATVFRRNVRPGWRILTPSDGFPTLPPLGIVLQRSDREPRHLIDRFVHHALDSVRQASTIGGHLPAT